MEKAKSSGISFGTTSGVITTLGLMTGLIASTYSKLAVIGGILTIAIADSMSDALGIHVSEESVGKGKKEVWKSTKYAFISKFLFSISFLVPVLLLESFLIISLVSFIWGGFLLTLISIHAAKSTKENKWYMIGEHLLIAVIVIVVTHFLGEGVRIWFG